MIRTEAEYQEAVKRLDAQKRHIGDERARLRAMKLNADQIKRALDPLLSFHAQLKEEVESHERLKRGEFGETINFEGLGQLLIALRIAQGLTQRELAQRLGVHESQVSRDERNEYHNITIERANRLLEVLGVEVKTTVEHIGRPTAKTA
jgi:ribosome-binding protein aMBF1 (putative translation factor)